MMMMALMDAVPSGPVIPVEPDVPVDPTPVDPSPVFSSIKSTGFKLALTSQEFVMLRQQQQDCIANEAVQFTMENELKTSRTLPTETTTNFKNSDEQIRWAKSKGLKVHGHTLWWVGKEPQWIKDKAKDPTMTPAKWRALLKYMIQTPILHHKNDPTLDGVVTSWDVLNEPAREGRDITTELKWKDSVFTKALGLDALKLAYVYAREVTPPNVLLMLNEYDWEFGGKKMDVIHNFIKECKAENIPLDGISLQFHRLCKSYQEASVRTQLKKLADTGLKLHISEVGLRLAYEPYIMNKDVSTFILTEEMKQVQADVMQKLVNAWITLVPDAQKVAFTMWGTYDPQYKWQGAKDYAMLWDNLWNRKPAYYAILNEIIKYMK